MTTSKLNIALVVILASIILLGAVAIYKVNQTRQTFEYKRAGVPVLISDYEGVKVYRIIDPASQRYVWYAVSSNNQPVSITTP